MLDDCACMILKLYPVTKVLDRSKYLLQIYGHSYDLHKKWYGHGCTSRTSYASPMLNHLFVSNPLCVCVCVCVQGLNLST